MESSERIFPKESVPGNAHSTQHNEYELDVYKLIHLTQEIPATTIPIESHMDELNDFCWSDENDNRITPKSVAEIYKSEGLEQGLTTHPELSEHLKKVDRADYSHPLLIFESKILDGMHRFVKAYSDGVTSLKVKIITSIPEAAIIKIHEKE